MTAWARPAASTCPARSTAPTAWPPGDLRGRQERHPPHDRSRSAPEGPGPRRHAGRGAVRHPGLHRAGSTIDEAAVEMRAFTTSGSPDSARRHPDRYAGLACIPSRAIDEAVGEIEAGGAARRRARASTSRRQVDMPPLWDPWWKPMWDAVGDCGLPMHFHTDRQPDPRRDPQDLVGPSQPRQTKARWTFGGPGRPPSHHQLPDVHVGGIACGMIYSGVLERYPAHQARHRRGRDRLDPLHPRAHGRSSGRTSSRSST